MYTVDQQKQKLHEKIQKLTFPSFLPIIFFFWKQDHKVTRLRTLSMYLLALGLWSLAQRREGNWWFVSNQNKIWSSDSIRNIMLENMASLMDTIPLHGLGSGIPHPFPVHSIFCPWYLSPETFLLISNSPWPVAQGYLDSSLVKRYQDVIVK